MNKSPKFKNVHFKAMNLSLFKMLKMHLEKMHKTNATFF